MSEKIPTGEAKKDPEHWELRAILAKGRRVLEAEAEKEKD